MSETTKLVAMAGLFEGAEDLVRAAQAVRHAGWRRWDCHSPYPVHGLGRAMGLARSPLAGICLAGGLCGAGLAILMQGWMNAVDYPIAIGGKPLFSWPAFVPITFELFVLFTALAAFGSLVLFCRLGRWHSPLHDAGIMAGLTCDRFAVVLDATDERFTREGARRLLEETGCKDIRPLYEIEEEEAEETAAGSPGASEP